MSAAVYFSLFIHAKPGTGSRGEYSNERLSAEIGNSDLVSEAL
jgi:hypothetical protein